MISIKPEVEKEFRVKAKEKLLSYKPKAERLKASLEVDAFLYRVLVAYGVAYPLNLPDPSKSVYDIVSGATPERFRGNVSPGLGTWSVRLKSGLQPIENLQDAINTLTEMGLALESNLSGKRMFLEYTSLLKYDTSAEISHGIGERPIHEAIDMVRGPAKISLRAEESGKFHVFHLSNMKEATLLGSSGFFISASPEELHKVHNASCLLAGLMVGLGANERTYKFVELSAADPRIGIYEALYDSRPSPRKHGFMQPSGFPDKLFSSYEEMVEHYTSSYPVLIVSYDKEHEGSLILRQVRKWVRLIYKEGELGVENFAMASNKPYWLAELYKLYIGLMFYLLEEQETAISKESKRLYLIAKESFSSCAYEGPLGVVPSLNLNNGIDIKGSIVSCLRNYIDLANAKLGERGIEEIDYQKIEKIARRK